MERSILPANWEVPAEFRERLGSTVGRQRAMTADGHLLLVLHRPPMPDEVQREARFFWRAPNGIWSSSDHGAGPGALSKHLDEYKEVLEQHDQLEQQATSAPEYFKVIDGLAPVLRAARNLHQAMQDGRKLCPADRGLIDHRDRAYEIERTAELLYTDARNSLDFLNAQRAEEQAASSHQMALAAHRLNSLAAFFLPLATICAILEVDPRNVEQHVRNPIAIIAIASTGMIAGWILMRAVSLGLGGRRTPAETAQPKASVRAK